MTSVHFSLFKIALRHSETTNAHHNALSSDLFVRFVHHSRLNLLLKSAQTHQRSNDSDHTDRKLLDLAGSKSKISNVGPSKLHGHSWTFCQLGAPADQHLRHHCLW